MYEKRRKGRKRRKRKKRDLSCHFHYHKHTRTSTLSLNSPSLYIYYIYNLESRIVLCALYRCLPASVTTSSILQAPIFFYPVLSLSATPTNSILDPPCIFHLLAFVTCRDTHDTRWHTNPRPTRRDISVTDDRSPVVDFHGELILFPHVDFSSPFFFRLLLPFP